MPAPANTGRGFAVVAEEVRSLAHRSATAAKDTAALIEENSKRVSQGVKVSEEAGKTLSEIVERAKKVSDLVGEIAAASQEQSKGIEEINGAVAQMDKVTQRNTSNAEELASSSEEMSSQAQSLKDMVIQLAVLPEGNSRPGNGFAVFLGQGGVRAKPQDGRVPCPPFQAGGVPLGQWPREIEKDTENAGLRGCQVIA